MTLALAHGESWAIIGRVGLGFKPLGLLGWDKDLWATILRFGPISRDLGLKPIN